MKVTGPLFSLDASGSLGGSIVASKWKGRNYMRRLVIPSNPRSSGQYAQRAMMRFLAQSWADMTALEQAAWQVLAAQDNVSPFNAFTKFNMNRWTQFTDPLVNGTPSLHAFSGGTYSNYVAGVGQISLDWTDGGTGQAWGSVVLLNLTADPTKSKAFVRYIAPLPRTASAVVPIVLTNVSPGTYRIKGYDFDGDGNFTALGASSGDLIVT